MYHTLYLFLNNKKKIDTIFFYLGVSIYSGMQVVFHAQQYDNREVETGLHIVCTILYSSKTCIQSSLSFLSFPLLWYCRKILDFKK